MFCLVSCSGRQLGTRARGARSTKASTAAFFLFIPIARGDFRPDKDADGRRRGGELGSGSLIGFPPSGSRKQSSIYIKYQIYWNVSITTQSSGAGASFWVLLSTQISFFSLSRLKLFVWNEFALGQMRFDIFCFCSLVWSKRYFNNQIGNNQSVGSFALIWMTMLTSFTKKRRILAARAWGSPFFCRQIALLAASNSFLC